MANIDAAFGLRPSRHLTGGSVVQNEFPIADGYTTAIYLGDPVKLNAGNIEIGAAAGVDHVGVFQGCEYIDPKGEIVFSKSWPGTAGCTKKKALIVALDGQVFKIQTDVDGSEVVIGTGYDLNIVSGDATIGQSKTSLDGNATTGAAYKILRFVERDDNEVGDYGDVEVIAVKHAFASS